MRPPLFAHDVLRLDVAVQQAGGVNGRQRRAQVQADQRRFRGTERAARLDDLLERFAAHQLHPQADAAVVLLGAIDLRRRASWRTPREAAGFFEQARVRVARRRRR